MGPTFGIKGGAAAGGYSQVVPMELLNLHLTGNTHTVTSAHNQLAAMIDNHLHFRDGYHIDPHSVSWQRVLDVNDRALRNTVVGLGGRTDGIPRETGFDITAASEVMAVLALSTSLADMRARLGRIVVASTPDGDPITAEDLRAAGAMTVMLPEAIKPNLLQTPKNTPVLVHTGPFGNIAHGNSSIVADRIGIKSSDFLVTEAGFGDDMGAERFFNFKCRVSGLTPDAAVLVAIVRGLKTHSGKHRVAAGRPLPETMTAENPDDVLAGSGNLRKQVENVRLHGVSDHDAIREVCDELGVRCVVATHFTRGGKGAVDLAAAVAEAADEPSDFWMLYSDDLGLKDKIETIATKVYGADGVEYDYKANQQLGLYEQRGYGHFPVCIATTHLSVSSDPAVKGAPTGWVLPVREVRASTGAGFIHPLAGDMRTMPGLSRTPGAEHIDIDAHGNIVGLS
jgi:formate--tetrahydrofolate ligase